VHFDVGDDRSIRRLVNWTWKLRYSGLPAMETLAETLDYDF
jgi:hypothetical protein